MSRFHALGWAAAAAAVFVLAGAPRAGGKPVDGSYGDLKEITLQGRLVSLGDELSRKYGARIAGGAAEKQSALALPEGQLYTFLDNEAYRKLTGLKGADKAVEVRARHFPRSMILEVLSARLVSAESLKRRFYCDVCAIYADDFGPCACCGKEVEIVKPGS